MEQTLTERQSREQCITNGNKLRQEQAHIPLCRDKFRGTCSNGARGVGNSQLHNENKDNDSRTRYTDGGRRSKSPCRDFLRGTCLFGSKCRRLHLVNTFVRSGTDFSNLGYIEGQQDVTLRVSQYHDRSNMGNPLRTGNILGNSRRRLPCRDFFSGKCYRGENCADLHPFPRYDQTRYCSRTSHFNDGLQLTNNRENMDITSRAELIREPEVCLMFNKGRCNFGDSCLYLHCYDKDTMQLKNVGQKGDDLVMEGQKCQLSEENSVGIWNRPLKRQRSRSRSPLTNGNDIRLVNLRSYDSRMDSSRDGCYNVASFQFPGHCSYNFKRPMYHENTGFCENCDFKSVGMQRHDEVVNKGSQIEKTNGKNVDSKHPENGYIIETIKNNVGPTLATIQVSRRKLLVLDINGLLADIVAKYPKCYKPGITLYKQGVFKRPFCDEFLQFCFERYDVGIWSSRKKKNVNKVVKFLLNDTQNRLLFCWDNSHCTPTKYGTLENPKKPIVLKELKHVWDNKWENLPWKKGYYNETNTILLDDSPYKALRNPPYTAVFPHPYTFDDKEDKSLGLGGDLRVYLERLAEAENVQKFIQENPFGQKPITKSSPYWAFYAKIVGP